RLDETRHLESEQHISQFLLAGRTLTDNAKLLRLHSHDVPLLQQDITGHLLYFVAFGTLSAPNTRCENTNVLLARRNGQSRLIHFRGDDDLNELALDDLPCCFRVKRTIE